METAIGQRIRIIHLNGENHDYDGREGVIEHIDSIGQLHGTWGGLAVIPGEDQFLVFDDIPTITISELATLLRGFPDNGQLQVNTLENEQGLNFRITRTTLFEESAVIIHAPSINEKAFVLADADYDGFLEQRLRDFFLSLDSEFAPDKDLLYLIPNQETK